MISGLLNRPRRKSKSAPKGSFRPTLEALEARNCPSPVITSFSAHPTNTPGSRQVELKGTVSDTMVQSDTVTFSGVATGSVQCDSGGNFDYFTGASGLGTVTAVASGHTYSPMMGNTSSASVNALITSAAPTITSFDVIQAGGGCWTFKGTVSDEAPYGIVVQFGGAWQVAGLSATCDLQGNFSATFYLPSLTSGSITAQCQDIWSLLSNTVTDPIV